MIDKLDTDADASIDEEEVVEAPGLAAGFEAIDTDSDKKLSREELISRFQLYSDMRVAITNLSLQVYLDRRPVRNVKVRLAPEFFLENVLTPATGETGPNAQAFLVSEGSKIPGIAPGYYRFEFVSDDGDLPAKLTNIQEIGIEVSPVSDSGYSTGDQKIFLTSR